MSARNLRTLGVGVLIGVAASTLAHWYFDREPKRSPEPKVAVADVAAPGETETADVIRAPASAAPTASASATDSASPMAPAPAATAAAIESVMKSRAQREREPKDLAWSHNTEQALRQFLADHPKVSQFDITRIDCRTTHCTVIAIGFDESTEPVWGQIVYDLKTQPWSDFYAYATTTTQRDGRPVYEGTLHRQVPGAIQVAD